MSDIRCLLGEKGLARIADAVEGAMKPSIRLSLNGIGEEPCTRLGGRPNLPPDIPWPKWKEQSLAFLAQLDLPALTNTPGLALPGSGALFFFHLGGENAPWGYDPKDRGCACVLYSETGLGDSGLRAFPSDIEEDRRYRGTALTAQTAEQMIPDPGDQVIEKFGLTAEEIARYAEVWEQWNSHQPDSYHRLGGYPVPIQGDLRLEAQLVTHGLYCGDGSGYMEGKRKGLSPGAEEWELLLQVDSVDDAGMMWGDCGCIYYLIRHECLEQRRFDTIWAGLQCY